MNTPKLNSIDHFHVYVTDKGKAALWYKKVLGFKVCQQLKQWDTQNGPLTLENKSKTIHLALFTKNTQPPSTSIAFNAGGKEFLQWKIHLSNLNVNLNIKDHQIAWSMYFSDPDNNVYEITTYEYDAINDFSK